jgi:hypothetical protein
LKKTKKLQKKEMAKTESDPFYLRVSDKYIAFDGTRTTLKDYKDDATLFVLDLDAIKTVKDNLRFYKCEHINEQQKLWCQQSSSYLHYHNKYKHIVHGIHADFTHPIYAEFVLLKPLLK